MGRWLRSVLAVEPSQASTVAELPLQRVLTQYQ
jgi:hypothetical protein